MYVRSKVEDPAQLQHLHHHPTQPPQELRHSVLVLLAFFSLGVLKATSTFALARILPFSLPTVRSDAVCALTTVAKTVLGA
jgi:hypothetical protein